MAQDRGQYDGSLHQREEVANAGARAGAEGQIGLAVARFFGGGLEAGGVESLGIGPDRGAVVEGIGADQHHGAARELVAADGDVGGGLAAEEIDGRIKAHGLFEDAEAIAERREVGAGHLCCGRTREAAGLGAGAGVGLGVAAEEVKRPGQARDGVGRALGHVRRVALDPRVGEERGHELA